MAAELKSSKAPLSFNAKDRTYATTVSLPAEAASWASTSSHASNSEQESDYNVNDENAPYHAFDEPQSDFSEVGLGQAQMQAQKHTAHAGGGAGVNLAAARDAPRGALSDALFRAGSGVGAANRNSSAKVFTGHDREGPEALASAAYDPGRYGLSPAKPQPSSSPSASKDFSATSAATRLSQTQTTAGTMQHTQLQEHEDNSGLGVYRGGAADSWQRSSRSSSKGSRYSEDYEADSQQEQEQQQQQQQYADDRHAQPVPAHAFQGQKQGQGQGLGQGQEQVQGKAPGRIEEEMPDGRRVVRYRNGTVKEVQVTGESLVRFLNGDTKWTSADSAKVIYFYAEAKTRHTTHSSGLEVYEFPNAQVERHHPDGIKEIIFPDRTRKLVLADGTQETHFPDGVKVRDFVDGRREIIYVP
jgi:centromere protein J